jgi:hypothetical protein
MEGERDTELRGGARSYTEEETQSNTTTAMTSARAINAIMT